MWAPLGTGSQEGGRLLGGLSPVCPVAQRRPVLLAYRRPGLHLAQLQVHSMATGSRGPQASVSMPAPPRRGPGQDVGGGKRFTPVPPPSLPLPSPSPPSAPPLPPPVCLFSEFSEGFV